MTALQVDPCNSTLPVRMRATALSNFTLQKGWVVGKINLFQKERFLVVVCESRTRLLGIALLLIAGMKVLTSGLSLVTEFNMSHRRNMSELFF